VVIAHVTAACHGLQPLHRMEKQLSTRLLRYYFSSWLYLLYLVRLVSGPFAVYPEFTWTRGLSWHILVQDLFVLEQGDLGLEV
jgi:hypothetical protein